MSSIYTENWEVGKRIVVAASDVNHKDKREIILEYIGNGYLKDVSNNNKVWFNGSLFPKVFVGMCLSLGLALNMHVCETYEVIKIL